MASVSRLIWAFACDKGLPFSNLFARVSIHIFQQTWHHLFWDWLQYVESRSTQSWKFQ
jgi:hypothetical protein